MTRLLLAFVMMALCGSASAGQTPVAEKITVAIKPLICAGMCPSFDLIVSSNGLLERHLCCSRHPAGNIRRSYISSQQFVAFEHTLAAIRPMASGPSVSCNGNGFKSGSPLPVEYDLHWFDAAGEVRLHTCLGDAPSVAVTDRALLILRVNAHDGYFIDEADSPSVISCRGLTTPDCVRR